MFRLIKSELYLFLKNNNYNADFIIRKFKKGGLLILDAMEQSCNLRLIKWLGASEIGVVFQDQCNNYSSLRYRQFLVEISCNKTCTQASLTQEGQRTEHKTQWLKPSSLSDDILQH